MSLSSPTLAFEHEQRDEAGRFQLPPFADRVQPRRCVRVQTGDEVAAHFEQPSSYCCCRLRGERIRLAFFPSFKPQALRLTKSLAIAVSHQCCSCLTWYRAVSRRQAEVQHLHYALRLGVCDSGRCTFTEPHSSNTHCSGRSGEGSTPLGERYGGRWYFLFLSIILFLRLGACLPPLLHIGCCLHLCLALSCLSYQVASSSRRRALSSRFHQREVKVFLC